MNGGFVGAKKRISMEHIETTKILNKIKGKVSAVELSQIKKALSLLKVAQETLISGERLHEDDLHKVGRAVGTRLKNAREAKSFSQEALEKVSKVSQSTISKIESGRRMISGNEARALAKVLGVTPQFLIAGD
jgi:ribosome-binding protein aMBF1 (putative translation factor)